MKRGGGVLKPKQSTGFYLSETIYYLICIVRSRFCFLERKTLQPITERWFTAFGKKCPRKSKRRNASKSTGMGRGGVFFFDLVTGHLHWNNFAQWLYRFNCCSSITAGECLSIDLDASAVSKGGDVSANKQNMRNLLDAVFRALTIDIDSRVSREYCL